MNLIDSIVKVITKRRQARYLESTMGWPTAVAQVIEWNVVSGEPNTEDAEKYQVQGTLGLTLGEGRFYGVLHSVGMIHGEAQAFVRSAPVSTDVTVRYDPADPGEMLPAPVAGQLPFEVRVP